MVNIKYETINYKTKEKVAVPKEQQVIVPDTHEPIITKEEFDKVQNLMLQSKRKPRHHFENMLKDMVFCSDCKQPLRLIARNTNTQSSMLFQCAVHRKNPTLCPKNHDAHYDDLLELISNIIKQYLNNLSDEQIETLYDAILKKQNQISSLQHKTIIMEKMDDIKKELKYVQKNYANNKLELSAYESLRAKYLEQQNQYLRELLQSTESSFVNLYSADTVKKRQLRPILQELSEDQEFVIGLIKRWICRIEIGPALYPEHNHNPYRGITVIPR